MKRRDDFSSKTRRQLERLAGHVCSICRGSTSGANADGSGEITIGTAAHISAAAPGGPRYDARMSPDERTSADNGIWLCRNHGDAIDDDPQFFTVERLKRLKREAEQASWRRVLGNLPPCEAYDLAEDVALREAARADLAVFRRTARWPRSTVALTLKIEGIDQTASTFGLAAASLALSDLVLIAPPGMGKTTTLLQIAEGVLACERGVPIFVSLADWATEGRTVLDSILARPAWRALKEHDLRSVSHRGDLVLLLDGWNELEPRARERARTELDRLKAELPELALVMSTRRQALDLPSGGTNIELLPLNERQQLEIAEALRGTDGRKLLDEAWRTPHVRDLVAIPLYLTTLMSLPPRSMFPETREEVLRRFVEAHEAQPGRIAKLRDALGEFARDYLNGLALAASTAATPAVSDTKARHCISATADHLVRDGQLGSRPDPAKVLEALVDNHVLVRGGDGSGIAFQHQQFEEWFASHGVERLMVAASKDAEARARLQREMLDLPGWEEAIVFAVERSSRGAATPAVVASAVLAGFEVDPLLAAEMIYRATDNVWSLVAETILERVRRWHKPGSSDRALRFMLDSGRTEFLDLVWPLITHENEQVSLKSLRNCRRFRPSILGPDAIARIRALPLGPRKILLHEVADNSGYDGLDLAVEIACTDPSLEVRAAVADALAFRHANRHLSMLLASSGNALFDHVSVPGYPALERLDPALTPKLEAARKRLRSKKTTAHDRLAAILFEPYDPALEQEVTSLVAKLNLAEKSDPITGRLRQLHEPYSQAIAHGMLLRLQDNQPLFYGAEDVLAHSGFALEDDWLVDLALAHTDRDVRAEASASVLGPKSTGRLIDALLPVAERVRDRSNRAEKAIFDRYHTLGSRLTHAPAASLVAAIQERSAGASSVELGLFLELLARNREDDDGRGRPFRGRTLGDVQELTLKVGEQLLEAPVATRHEVAKVANLIAVVPDDSFLPLLQRMLDANLADYSNYRAEAAASGWQQGKARDEASWPMTGEYLRAFLAIDAPETAALMHGYLDHPYFGEEAAQVLTSQWVRIHEPLPKFSFGRRGDFSHVAARRAQRIVDPSSSVPDADVIFGVIERLIADGTTDEQRQLAVTLACYAARLPHGDRPVTIARLISLAHRRIRPRLLSALIQSGEMVETEIVALGIAETLEAAKTETWILHESGAYQLTDWFALLPFTDDLGKMIEVLRAIPPEHRRLEWLEKILPSLTETPTPGGEKALFALAEIEPQLYESYDWYAAALALRTETAAHKLIAIVADGPVVGGRSPIGSWRLSRDLGALIAEYPAVRGDLYARLADAEMSTCNLQFAQAVAEALNEKGLILLLGLERRWQRRLISYHQIRDLVTDQVPAQGWTNAFSIVPRPASSLRKSLLALTSDGSDRDLPARVLNAIDEIRDEYGRAIDEPRHPDLASGRPWPILVPDPDVTSD